MPAGTITLMNNSAAVTGTGTSFTEELKVNDFLVATAGGTVYTLGVKSIESDGALTLLTNYRGPSASDLAWTPIPFGTMAAITAEMAEQVTNALRGLNLDKANWQKILTGTGTVVVNLQDGSSWEGIAWNSIVSALNDKAESGENKDITGLKGLKTALSIEQGGTGATTLQKALENLGLSRKSAPYFSALELFSGTPFIDFHFASSDEDYNVRLINDASGVLRLVGQFDPIAGITSRAGTNGAVDLNVPWNFFWNYGGDVGLTGFVGTTKVGRVSFVSSSDRELKKEIEYVSDRKVRSGISANEEALQQVLQWKVATFKMKERGLIPESEKLLGFIANDMVEVSPECVGGKGLGKEWNEDDPAEAYYLREVSMIAKMTQAIQAQQRMIVSLNRMVDELQVLMKNTHKLE